MAYNTEEDTFAAGEEEKLLNEIEVRSSQKAHVKVKPRIPLDQLAAPLLAKWGK